MGAPDILIYQDYIHNNGQLYAALTDRFGHSSVGFCDASSIISGALNAQIRLFVMPGGADLYYCEKLNGTGNDRIRAYAKNGGSYLGICAGAYYACASIDWAAGSEQHIGGSRELGFYNGMATGPVMDYLQDGDLNKSWLHAAALTYNDGDAIIETLTCYEAGPVFSAGEGKILAHYRDGGTAIVECKIGNGRAILSSPHIERIGYAGTLYSHRNENYPYDYKVLSQLLPHATGQKQLWNIVLDRLTGEQKQKNAA